MDALTTTSWGCRRRAPRAGPGRCCCTAAGGSRATSSPGSSSSPAAGRHALSWSHLALRAVLARGGGVGGTRAGMAALPRIMTLYQRRRRAGAPLSVVAAHGLGLLDDAIVEQHFDSRTGRLERFTGLLRDSAQL